MTKILNAPCGCPLSVFTREGPAERRVPIILPGQPGYTVAAIWCAGEHGWVNLNPADHLALVLDKQAPVPTDPEELSHLLAATLGDEQRRSLFGLLQDAVGKGPVNSVWYRAMDLELGLPTTGGDPQ